MDWHFNRLSVHMFNLAQYGHALITALVVTVIAGCASLPDDASLERRVDQMDQTKVASQTYLQRAKVSMTKARTENLALYGPTYLQKATHHYEEAQQQYKAQQDESAIKREAQLAIEYIQAGLRNKRVVKDALKKSLEHHQILMQLNAAQVNAEQYSLVLNDLLNLVRLIEQRNLDSAIAQEDAVIQSMREFEVTIIDQKYLKQCVTLLKQSESKQGKKWLPDTYASVFNQIQDTQQFIRQNPRQASKIESLANQCTFQAQRLLHLTEEAIQIHTLNDNQVERYVLTQEERMNRIAKKLNEKDLRNRSLDDQSRLLSDQAEASLDLLVAAENDNEKLSPAQFEKWKRKTVLLQAEVRRLKKIIRKLENN